MISQEEDSTDYMTVAVQMAAKKAEMRQRVRILLELCVVGLA
jgi:hypothetical protein